MTRSERVPEVVPAPSLLETPMPRRRMLLFLGAGVLLTGTGLGTLLEGCAPVAPVTVTLQVNPSTLPQGVPVEVPLQLTNASGAWVVSSVWMLRNADGTLVAYDPRCTHALCKYKWFSDQNKFLCNCHGGQFALDGSVLAGPPPKPLNKFPLKETGGVVTVDVPGDFVVPRESLGT